VIRTIDRLELVAQLARSPQPVLVEALGWAYFANAHLPGAINIPPGQVDRLAPQQLPDRQVAVVVYCSGACDSSNIVAQRLQELGYADVSIYLGGKEDWVEHGLAVDREAERD